MTQIIHYVLIVMMVSDGSYSHGNPAIAITDFDSQKLCQTAVNEINKNSRFDSTNVIAICVQKTL